MEKDAPSVLMLSHHTSRQAVLRVRNRLRGMGYSVHIDPDLRMYTFLTCVTGSQKLSSLFMVPLHRLSPLLTQQWTNRPKYSQHRSSEHPPRQQTRGPAAAMSSHLTDLVVKVWAWPQHAQNCVTSLTVRCFYQWKINEIDSAVECAMVLYYIDNKMECAIVLYYTNNTGMGFHFHDSNHDSNQQQDSWCKFCFEINEENNEIVFIDHFLGQFNSVTIIIVMIILKLLAVEH